MQEWFELVLSLCMRLVVLLSLTSVLYNTQIIDTPAPQLHPHMLCAAGSYPTDSTAVELDKNAEGHELGVQIWANT
jgi:hypothetical protein